MSDLAAVMESETPEPPLPLAGVRVLDFTRILSGPYCTLLLSELGAEVIKIERPDGGDDTRAWGPPFVDEEAGLSTYFSALNRGKRSVALDLGNPKDLDAFRALVAHSDVVVENFRPGVAERYGLHYDALRDVNPRIVTCAISGFGRQGPFASLPGTEIVVEAMSGLMSVTGSREGEPVRFGIAMTDIATGLTAATRIVAGVLSARESGTGSHIDTSLYATAIGALGTLVAGASINGRTPERWGSHHPSIVPYGGFPTSDGDVITGVVNDRTWPAFCEAIGLPELSEDYALSTNAGRVRQRESLEKRIGEATRAFTTVGLLEHLQSRGLLAAPIRTVTEMLADPDTRALGLIAEGVDHPGLLTTRVSGMPSPQGVADAPALGVDTKQVLRDVAGIEY
ncbi:CaiB/BaiF CoA transferase family protein [Leucobacter sp. Z1108]|uniref:CaiB/BaiF CoA transferase family protein n=1 Tax=Leucobacter sp. Z1108 TaxID=3439066 RepID=UPI003F3D5E83